MAVTGSRERPRGRFDYPLPPEARRELEPDAPEDTERRVPEPEERPVRRQAPEVVSDYPLPPEARRELAPPPQPPKADYKPGSTMYRLGFRTKKEYLRAQRELSSYGLHSGSLIPKQTILLTNRSGEPIARYSPGQLSKLAPDYLIDVVEQKKYRFPIKSHRGHTVLLTPDQANVFQAGTQRQQFELAKKLDIIPKTATLIGGEGKRWTYIPHLAFDLKQRAWERATARQLKKFQDAHTQLPDGQYIEKDILAAYKKNYPVAHRILTNEGFESYQTQYNRALSLVGKAGKDGTYDIKDLRIVNPGWLKSEARGGAQEKVEAIELLFDPESVAQVKKYWRYDSKAPPTTEELKARREQQQKAPDRGKLAPLLITIGAVATAARVTPTPWGKVALYAILAALAVYAGEELKKGELPAHLKSYVDDYKKAHGRLPRSDEILIADSQGYIKTMADTILFRETGALPTLPPVKGKLQEATKPSKAPPKVEAKEQVTTVEINTTLKTTPAIRPEDITKALDQPIPGTHVHWQEPVIILPGTMTPVPKRILENAKKTLEETSGMLLAAEQVQTVIERSIPKSPATTLPYTREEYRRIYESIPKTREQLNALDKRLAEERVKKALSAIPERGARADISNSIRIALAEYYRQKAVAEAARRAYVESLNPRYLIRGKVSDAAQDAYFAYALSNHLNLAAPKAKQGLSEYILSQTKSAVKTITQTATQTAAQTLTKALAQGKTMTQAQTAAETATQTAIRTAVKTITNTAVRAAVATLVTTLARTATRVAVMEQTMTRTSLLPPPVPPIKLPRGGKKDWTEKEAKSAIALLHGVIVHAIKSPYRRGIDEASFHKDNLPKGLKVLTGFKGVGSVERSAVFKGKPPKRITMDVGNQDLLITSRGNRLRITHRLDRGSRTRMQTTIKRRNISRKRGRVYHTRMGGDTIISKRRLQSV